MFNPWMKTIVVSGPAKSLLAYMEALDPAWNNTPRAVSCVQLQLDINAGGIHLYVGNSQVSATDRGFELIADQAGPNSMPIFGNAISLASIWLLSSSIQEEVQVNVTVIQA